MSFNPLRFVRKEEDKTIFLPISQEAADVLYPGGKATAPHPQHPRVVYTPILSVQSQGGQVNYLAKYARKNKIDEANVPGAVKVALPIASKVVRFEGHFAHYYKELQVPLDLNSFEGKIQLIMQLDASDLEEVYSTEDDALTEEEEGNS